MLVPEKEKLDCLVSLFIFLFLFLESLNVPFHLLFDCLPSLLPLLTIIFPPPGFHFHSPPSGSLD